MRIVVIDSEYADKLAVQIELCTDLQVLIRLMLPDVDILDQVEAAMARRVLFLVIVTAESQINNSITVDILHGEPEG